MQHIMLDAYSTQNNFLLNDLKYTYDSLVYICNKLNLKPITPPVLIPYYYGSVKEDDGISTYVLLEGGHLTFHSFPERQCYFVDIFSQDYINDEKMLAEFSFYFPFSAKPIFNNVDRRFDVENQLSIKNEIDETEDFGPHYLIETTKTLDLDIDKIFHILDELPNKIGMDSIMRPLVVTDKVSNWNFISGLTVIAQSHISIHYNVSEKIAYIDIFSCSFIKGDSFVKELEAKLGVPIKSILITRGSKHSKHISLREDMIDIYKHWENVIK